jgi:shikimate dehydrogenase
VATAYPACRAKAGPADPAGFDIAVNTTSLGMKPGDADPMDLAGLAPSCVAAEVVMTPEMTPFLTAASARGCRIVLGKEMLLAQMQAASDLVGL